jgi:hypothetical protein
VREGRLGRFEDGGGRGGGGGWAWGFEGIGFVGVLVK